MRLKRFQKASELASKSNTWNSNGVADAINERLQFERENQIKIELPAGKNGKFIVGARSNYAKLFNKLFPGDAKVQRQSPKNLMKKSLTVKVRTVITNEKQKRLAEYERYSIVGDILEFA